MRPDIELLRIISAFGIVWFHSGYGYGRDIAYAGLIVFLILSAYFATKSMRVHSVVDRAIRLLVPCLLWSGLYAILSIVRGQPMFPGDYSIVSNILSTPSIHLWYLPFVFFCIISIDRIKIYNSAKIAIFIAILTSMLLLVSPLWRQWTYISPLGQYMHAFPAILIGMLLAICGGEKVKSTLKYFLLCVVSISAISILFLNIQGVSLTYVVGIGAALLLLKGKSALPENRAIIEFSKLTFGIYLVHPLILSVMRYIGINSLILPIAAFSISALCIYAISKIAPNPILKYII